MKNLRFNVYWNGSWTTLTLVPGQVIELYQRWTDEEGYGFRRENYQHCPNTGALLAEFSSGGRDCDGYIENWSYASAEEFYKNDEGCVVPLWIDEKSGQYDQFAELMGY